MLDRPTLGLQLLMYNMALPSAYKPHAPTCVRRVCGNNTVCVNGQCAACKPGFGNCDGSWDNGCEVNLNNNAANCGAVSCRGSATARCSAAGPCVDALRNGMRIPLAVCAKVCPGSSPCSAASRPADWAVAAVKEPPLLPPLAFLQCGNACELFQKCVGGKKQCSESSAGTLCRLRPRALAPKAPVPGMCVAYRHCPPRCPFLSFAQPPLLTSCLPAETSLTESTSCGMVRAGARRCSVPAASACWGTAAARVTMQACPCPWEGLLWPKAPKGIYCVWPQWSEQNSFRYPLCPLQCGYACAAGEECVTDAEDTPFCACTAGEGSEVRHPAVRVFHHGVRCQPFGCVHCDSPPDLRVSLLSAADKKDCDGLRSNGQEWGRAVGAPFAKGPRHLVTLCSLPACTQSRLSSLL